MVARFKPSKALREQTHEASEIDYAKLAAAVVHAIVLKQKDLVIRLPYFAKLADDWPRGLLIRKDSTHNFFKVKVFKLADWLHSKGHLAQDAKGVVKSMRAVSNLTGEIERMLSQPEDLVYNNRIGVKNITEE